MFFNNLVRPRKAPRMGLTVAAATVLVAAGGWVALAPPAQAALPAGCAQAAPGSAVTCTFGYTGAAQTFTVPAGVTSVTVTAWGGHGATALGVTERLGTGGRGALVNGVFAVASGDVLTATVGGDGTSSGGGGFGAGSGGGTANARGAGGGGASSLSQASTVLLVAGAGGGGGYGYDCGTAGNGGDAGQDGTGGTGCGNDRPGGLAGASSTSNGTSSDHNGGGGGGGHLGGTSGTSTGQNENWQLTPSGGGGGGTSYASPSGTAVSLSGLSERALGSNGLITISYLPGTVTQLVVSPAAGTVAAGQGQAYTANGYTAEGADAGNVTSATTFTIIPDGSCSGATCTPASAGPHTVTATYGSATATASLDVTPPPLVYDFSGLLSPIDAQPTVNKAKAGSSVPVKFSLGANYGLDVLAEGSPSVRTVACDSGAPADELEQTLSTNKSGLTYDAASGIYTYVWKTDKKWGGTCRSLTVTLTDGSSQTVGFSFK